MVLEMLFDGKCCVLEAGRHRRCLGDGTLRVTRGKLGTVFATLHEDDADEDRPASFIVRSAQVCADSKTCVQVKSSRTTWVFRMSDVTEASQLVGAILGKETTA